MKSYSPLFSFYLEISIQVQAFQTKKDKFGVGLV